MGVYNELQHALLHVFRDKEFQCKLAQLRKPLDLPAKISEKDWLRAAGQQWKQIHDYVQRAQLPILERFGFPKNLKGALLMEQYLIAKYQDSRTTVEMRERAHELERLVKGVSRHDTDQPKSHTIVDGVSPHSDSNGFGKP